MKHLVFLMILVFGQTVFSQNAGQKVSEDYVRQIFKHYSATDLKVLDFADDNVSFNDFTMGIKYNSKEQIRKTLINPANSLKNFKAEIKKIFYISPYVVDVHGVNSGLMDGKPFRTLFSTALIFDKNKKIVSWTDHVDPNTFTGNSPVTEKNKQFIKDFFKAYSKLDTSAIDKYVDENVRLIDPTLKLDYKGLQKIKQVWDESKQIFESGIIKINKLYFITENVIDVQGMFDVKTRKGKRLLTPFSTVFMLENGKIKHWVDHVDREAFRGI